MKYIQSFDTFKMYESLSTAKAKYLVTGEIDEHTFDELKSIDPSPTLKYIEAIAKFYTQGATIDDLKSTIDIFHEMNKKNQLKQKDLNAYRSFEELKDILTQTTTDYDKKQDLKSKAGDAKIVYESERFLVMVPLTHEASCKYGAGTKWCITSIEDPLTWNQYKNKDVTHYFILDKKLIKILSEKDAVERDLKNKKITESEAREKIGKLELQAKSIGRTLNDNLYKMAVSVLYNGRFECKDAQDRTIQLRDVLKKTGLTKDLFVRVFDSEHKIKEIKDIVKNGGDINQVIDPENGDTMLHVEVEKGREDTVNLLINLGADINKPNLMENTPLHAAVITAKYKIANMLIKAGADVNSVDNQQMSLLDWAMEFDDIKMAKILVKAGAELGHFSHEDIFG